ncbi:MAG: CehA/McbA family metallohydrolase [Chloroflexota bacterium]
MHEIIVNLHMHTRYSDGSGSHEDIARAALKCGLDAVLVTDHNVLVEGMQGCHREGQRRLLMLIGQEVHDQDRDPQKNHLLIFGAGRDLATLADDPQALVNAVREAGGICFIAHPTDPAAPLFNETDISWEAWDVQGFTGLEIWNHFSEFKTVLTNWPSALFHAYFPNLFSRGPFPRDLKKWDELLAGGRRVAVIGGSDAHALHYKAGPLGRTIFPYEFHFKSLNTHLLLPNPLTGEFESDQRMVLDALGAGRGFVGFDLIAPTRGFRFTAQGREVDAVMGEEIPALGGVTLQARLPGLADIRLIRDGQIIQKWKRREAFTYNAAEPGAYRVEVYRNYRGVRRGWIFSNPIYVK